MLSKYLTHRNRFALATQSLYFNYDAQIYWM